MAALPVKQMEAVIEDGLQGGSYARSKPLDEVNRLKYKYVLSERYDKITPHKSFSIKELTPLNRPKCDGQ